MNAWSVGDSRVASRITTTQTLGCESIQVLTLMILNGSSTGCTAFFGNPLTTLTFIHVIRTCDMFVRPLIWTEIFQKKSGDLTLSLSRQLGRSASYPSSSSDSQERGPTTGACRGLATRQASSGSGIGTIGTTKPQNEGSDLADHHSQCKWIGEVFFIGLVFFTKGLPIWRHIGIIRLKYTYFGD